MIDSSFYLYFVIFILLIGIFIKNKKNTISLIGLFSVIIGAITVYNNAILLDEMNLHGDIKDVAFFIISVILFIILILTNREK